MRKTYRLNQSQSSLSIDTDFEAASIIVNNPTASPVFIRIGAPDIPTSSNADLFIPAGESVAWPVSGYSFAAVFGQPASVGAGNIPSSGLFQTCVITLLDKSEVVPSYGSASFLSLSVSDLWNSINGGGPFVFPVMDLGAWGGSIIFIEPTSTSGQLILKLEISVDQSQWITAGQWAAWPSIPAILNIPRLARYARVSTINSGIPGEPSIAYAITARASLSEITQLTYVPFAASVQKVVNVPNIGEQNWTLCTMNTPAIDVSLDITSVGSGSAAEELICETSFSPTGPWQQVSFREQNSAPLTGDLFRSYGNLNVFTRIRLLEIGNGGPLGGNINFSIRPEPDLSGILQSIYAALGDVGYSVNTNQDIFHVLLNSNTSLSNISTNTANATVYMSQISTNTGNTNANCVTIAGNTNTTATNTGNINTTLGTTNSTLSSINTTLGTVNTNIATLANAQTRTGGIISGQYSYNPVTQGAYIAIGAAFPANWFIESAFASVFCTAAYINVLPLFVEMAFGTIGAAVTAFYTVFPTIFSGTIGGTAIVQGAGPTQNYGGIRSPGLNVTSNTYLWVRSCPQGGPILIDYCISVTP